MMLFSGNANPLLASALAIELNITLGRALVSQFKDGETRVQINEDVRGKDVFLLQPTSAPVNNHLMELAFMADALVRGFPKRISAIIPYFGYARQDRTLINPQVPLSAKVVANLIAHSGIKRLIVIDLHSDHLQGFFPYPIDHLNGFPVFLNDYKRYTHSNPIVVSPDIGGVVRARAFAQELNHADLAIVDKRRPEPNKARVLNVIGNIENRNCIIIDDMIDTGQTITETAVALKQRGAKQIITYCTHAVLSNNSVELVEMSPIDQLIVTDTIPLSTKAIGCKKIRQISIVPLLSKAIQLIHSELL